FSHSRQKAPSVMVLNMEEAVKLARYITGESQSGSFFTEFEGKYSENFDPTKDFEKVGVVNQTTMLASETHEISEFFRKVMLEKYGAQNLDTHFTDTRDTLCYATNDNQEATLGLLTVEADLALVVGGYNSSNTSHLVELLEKKFKTYYISNVEEIISEKEIRHFDYHSSIMVQSTDFLPQKTPTDIILSSGASCPDAAVDAVLDRILGFYTNVREKKEILRSL
ncbi:MAG: 4-hydroxy-3-methylbut-2-enyl diphosphate reductase, partial [Flavobacteriales bacterium]|nr:4-hydroxy-3-methylbut-2-enyl diphosphate reductase [Flavobacteriales bacterium]